MSEHATEHTPHTRLRRWVLPVLIVAGLCVLAFLAALPFLLRQISFSRGGGGSQAEDRAPSQPVVLPDAYREPTTTYGPPVKAEPAPVAPIVQASLTPLPGLGNGATPPAPAALGGYQRQRVDTSQIPTAVLQNGHKETHPVTSQPAAQVTQPGRSAEQAVAKPGGKEKGRWGIELTHGQQRQPRQATPKEREDTAQRDKAKNLFKHAIWARPQFAEKTLYRQQAIPGVTIDEMVSDIPGQYKIRVSVPVFNRFNRDVELIPKDSVVIVVQKRVPGYGEKRLELGVEEIQPPTPEVISLTATVSDKEGGAGIGGDGVRVNNHLPQLILATLISTAINIGGRVVAGSPQGYQYSVGQEISRDVGQQVSQDTKSIVDRTLRLPPTITVPAGTPVSISLMENIMLSRTPLVVK